MLGVIYLTQPFYYDCKFSGVIFCPCFEGTLQLSCRRNVPLNNIYFRNRNADTWSLVFSSVLAVFHLLLAGCLTIINWAVNTNLCNIISVKTVSIEVIFYSSVHHEQMSILFICSLYTFSYLVKVIGNHECTVFSV
jgi:hypothetical protein